jgi:hypothetical protein
MPTETPARSKPRLRLLNNTVTRPFETAEKGGWPAVSGTVRPPAPREVRAYFDRCAAEKTGEGLARVQAEFYAGLVKSWDVADGEDADAPAVAVTAETVGALPFPVFDQLEGICLGYLGGDLLGNSASSSAS